MESEYVKQTVGPALALGLAEIALRRPTDPIEYLGLWLLNHKKNLQEASQKTEEPVQNAQDIITDNQETTIEEPYISETEPVLTVSDTQEETHTTNLTTSRPGSKLSRIEEGDETNDD